MCMSCSGKKPSAKPAARPAAKTTTKKTNWSTGFGSPKIKVSFGTRSR